MGRIIQPRNTPPVSEQPSTSTTPSINASSSGRAFRAANVSDWTGLFTSDADSYPVPSAPAENDSTLIQDDPWRIEFAAPRSRRSGWPLSGGDGPSMASPSSLSRAIRLRDHSGDARPSAATAARLASRSAENGRMNRAGEGSEGGRAITGGGGTAHVAAGEDQTWDVLISPSNALHAPTGDEDHSDRARRRQRHREMMQRTHPLSRNAVLASMRPLEALLTINRTAAETLNPLIPTISPGQVMRAQEIISSIQGAYTGAEEEFWIRIEVEGDLRNAGLGHLLLVCSGADLGVEHTGLRSRTNAAIERHFSQLQGEGDMVGVPVPGSVIRIYPVLADWAEVNPGTAASAGEQATHSATSDGRQVETRAPAERDSKGGSGGQSQRIMAQTDLRFRTESEQVIDQATEEDQARRFEQCRQAVNEQSRSRARAVLQEAMAARELAGVADESAVTEEMIDDFVRLEGGTTPYNYGSRPDRFGRAIGTERHERGVAGRGIGLLERVTEADEPDVVIYPVSEGSSPTRRRSLTRAHPQDRSPEPRRIRRRTERMLEADVEIDHRLRELLEQNDRAGGSSIISEPPQDTSLAVAESHSLGPLDIRGSPASRALAAFIGETETFTVAGIGRTDPPSTSGESRPPLAFGTTRRYFDDPALDFPYIAPELLRSAVAGGIAAPTTSSNVATSPLSLTRRAAVRRRRPLDPSAAPFVPFGESGSIEAYTSHFNAASRRRVRAMRGEAGDQITDKFLTKREWEQWVAARPMSASALAVRHLSRGQGTRTESGSTADKLELTYAEPRAVHSNAEVRRNDDTSSLTRSEEVRALFGSRSRSPSPEINFFAQGSEREPLRYYPARHTYTIAHGGAGNERPRPEGMSEARYARNRRYWAERGPALDRDPHGPILDETFSSAEDESLSDGDVGPVALEDLPRPNGSLSGPGLPVNLVAATSQYGLDDAYESNYPSISSPLRPRPAQQARPRTGGRLNGMTYEDIVDELRRAEGDPDNMMLLESGTII